MLKMFVGGRCACLEFIPSFHAVLWGRWWGRREVLCLKMLRVACSGCGYRMQMWTSCCEWGRAARFPIQDDSESSLSQRLTAVYLPSEQGMYTSEV